MRTRGFGDRAWTPTSGVSPMSPSTSSCLVTRSPRGSGPRSPSRDGREDGDRVAVGDLGVELVEVPDVVVVAVHVDELVETTRLVGELAGQAGMTGHEVGEHLPHRAALG